MPLSGGSVPVSAAAAAVDSSLSKLYVYGGLDVDGTSLSPAAAVLDAPSRSWAAPWTGGAVVTDLPTASRSAHAAAAYSDACYDGDGATDATSPCMVRFGGSNDGVSTLALHSAVSAAGDVGVQDFARPATDLQGAVLAAHGTDFMLFGGEDAGGMRFSDTYVLSTAPATLDRPEPEEVQGWQPSASSTSSNGAPFRGADRSKAFGSSTEVRTSYVGPAWFRADLHSPRTVRSLVLWMPQYWKRLSMGVKVFVGDNSTNPTANHLCPGDGTGAAGEYAQNRSPTSDDPKLTVLCSARGRFVFVYRPYVPGVYSFLIFSELQVFADPLPLVSMHGDVTASSVASAGAPATWAVDGLASSVFATAVGDPSTPWVRVDLGRELAVQGVRLWTPSELSGPMTVWAGANGAGFSEPGNTRCTWGNVHTGKNRFAAVNCPVSAQYVFVALADYEPTSGRQLQLAEVEVWAEPATRNARNLARAPSASVVVNDGANAPGVDAALLVDGDNDLTASACVSSSLLQGAAVTLDMGAVSDLEWLRLWYNTDSMGRVCAVAEGRRLVERQQPGRHRRPQQRPRQPRQRHTKHLKFARL